MTRRARTVAVLAAAVTASMTTGPVAASQEAGPGSVPRLFGTFAPSPGVWSEYAVFDKETRRTTKMRMSIVGQEDGSFWYEVNQADGTNRNIIKMLVKGDPNDPDNIQRLILKSGDSPAAEMPRDFVAMGRKMAVYMFERRSGVPAAPEEGEQLKVEELGTAEVKVPAGVFQATLRRIVNGSGTVLATSYFSPDIPPFGVVSSETASSRMELLGHGRDARSAITETPVPMTTPPGMPKGMPRGAPPGLLKGPGKSTP